MRCAKFRALMGRRYLGHAVNVIFAIEESANSWGISTAHEAIDCGEATPFQQRNDGSPVRVPSTSQNSLAQCSFVSEQGQLVKRDVWVARFALCSRPLRLPACGFIAKIIVRLRFAHGDAFA
ncbi:hypothetical protein [Bradyrhizobium sp. NP1]|uniref:hypothetical protein n=1 Tax=Bradyrhizobium sp. NP1 TaxID=3049772 RepID=UPI0025A61989|nr:hypothetical protein [Bradyrhizobium sp. NP1]WJR74925.1 hypothetical protein QOU61_19040 [Bradyrhizobium sp. NP1]